jgi:hypothetical protein
LGAEERRYRRFRVNVTVELASGGGMQVCQTDDLSAGGARIQVLFPLQQGGLVRVRLRSERVAFEVSGGAAIAWANREPPYAAGLSFDDALVGEAARFLRALLGPVTLVNAPPRAG